MKVRCASGTCFARWESCGSGWRSWKLRWRRVEVGHRGREGLVGASVRSASRAKSMEPSLCAMLAARVNPNAAEYIGKASRLERGAVSEIVKKEVFWKPGCIKFRIV